MTGVAIFAAGYLGLCLFMFAAQRSFLYVPDRSRPDPRAFGVPGMTAVDLVAEDGAALYAWYLPPADDRRPLIVYFHGNAGHVGYRGQKMAPLMDAGFGLLLLSYRGYGGNQGQPSEAGFYADARAALDFAGARGYGADRLVIYGESLGSGVAVQMAAERSIAALILEAPFTSLARVAFEKVPYVPVPLLIRDRFDSLRKIDKLRVPVLVIHGDEDRTVPVRHGRALLAAANDPKEALFVPGAGHADLYDFGVVRQVQDFISRTMGQAASNDAASAPLGIDA